MLKYKITGMLVAIMLLSPTCFANTVKCKVTTYNPTVAQCGNSRNMTCSGVRGKKGICAADLRLLPIGSILYCIETTEILVVGDSGGAVRGYHIDRFRLHQYENRQCSGGTLTMYILYKAPRTPRSQWKSMVENGFAIRNRLAYYRKHNLVSRGGLTRLKTRDIPRMLGELKGQKSHTQKSITSQKKSGSKKYNSPIKLKTKEKPKELKTNVRTRTGQIGSKTNNRENKVNFIGIDEERSPTYAVLPKRSLFDGSKHEASVKGS